MLPAVLAISVALLTRKIFLGLGIGVVAGALVAQGGDPGGSLAAIWRYLFAAVFDQSHAAIVIFSFLVAATANILTDSGAVTALILRLGNLSGRRRSLMGTSWLAGLVVFFDDYANCLIVGKSFAPIYDRCKISREKLAYIVDSTAAPIASIAIISTWIGFELDLIDKALKGSQASGSAFSVFLQSIPFRFYSIFTLAFVACIAFTGRDFGPMAGVELKAARRLPSQRDAQEPAPNPRLAWLALTAIGLLVLSTVATLVFSGWSRTVSAGGSATVLEIVGNSDPFQAILVGSTVAFLFAVLSSLKLKLHSIHLLLLSVGGGFHSILGATDCSLPGLDAGQCTRGSRNGHLLFLPAADHGACLDLAQPVLSAGGRHELLDRILIRHHGDPDPHHPSPGRRPGSRQRWCRPLRRHRIRPCRSLPGRPHVAPVRHYGLVSRGSRRRCGQPHPDPTTLCLHRGNGRSAFGVPSGGFGGIALGADSLRSGGLSAGHSIPGPAPSF